MSTITLTQKKCIFFLSVNSSIKPYLSEAYKPRGPFPYHTELPSGDGRRFRRLTVLGLCVCAGVTEHSSWELFLSAASAEPCGAGQLPALFT